MDISTRFGLTRLQAALLLGGIIVYAITCVNSVGYYHADEHYQILEYANYKMGNIPVEGLAWEFGAHVRSAFQPSVCVVFFKAMGLVGCSDPYTLALALRVLTAVLALASILFFLSTVLPSVEERMRTLLVFLTLFLWFLPALNVRFTSENWSGMFFLAALALVLRWKAGVAGHRGAFLLAGALVGLSFLCRYQMGVAAGGLFLWMALVSKAGARNLLLFALAAAAMLGLGFAIDCWFYGQVVCTPWNYFHTTLVADNVIDFGSSPWYDYLRYVYRYATAPLGILILLCLAGWVVSRPTSVLTWVIVPFVLVHSAIPHKELRFLFPLINLLPLIIVAGIGSLVNARKGLAARVITSPTGKVVLVLVAVLLLLGNMLALAVMSSKGAGLARMTLTRCIHDDYRGKPVRLVCPYWSNPYDPWQFHIARFYLDSNIESVRLEKLSDLGDSVLSPSRVNLMVVFESHREDADFARKMDSLGFVKVTQNIPPWCFGIMKFFGCRLGCVVHELYEQKTPPAGRGNQR